jgi:hypothetical protein
MIRVDRKGPCCLPTHNSPKSHLPAGIPADIIIKMRPERGSNLRTRDDTHRGAKLEFILTKIPSQHHESPEVNTCSTVRVVQETWERSGLGWLDRHAHRLCDAALPSVDQCQLYTIEFIHTCKI